MSNEKNLPQRVGADAPSWLADVARSDESLSQVKKYRRLGRLKIVQGNSPSAKARIKQFGEGAVITQPGESLVAKPKEPFCFVPLFMFTEFCQWKDRDDESKDVPMIVERTFDELSRVAQCARDKNRRREYYGPTDAEHPGGKYQYRYVEHLCFPGIVYSGPLAGTPVTISFEKGEFMRGNDWCSAIMLRRVGDAIAPLWTQVWELRSGDGEDGHRNPQYEWWGFNYSTPDLTAVPDPADPDRDRGPFILFSEVDAYRRMHEDLREKYAAQELEVDRSDADEDVEAAAVINEDGM